MPRRVESAQDNEEYARDNMHENISNHSATIALRSQNAKNDLAKDFKKELDATKRQLDQLYRQWGSDNFHNSVKMGTEQFNVIFNMFDKMSNACKDLIKQNKVFFVSNKID